MVGLAGGGIAAEPLERLFSAVLKAWKMMAAARPRGTARAGGGWFGVRGTGGRQVTIG